MAKSGNIPGNCVKYFDYLLPQIEIIQPGTRARFAIPKQSVETDTNYRLSAFVVGSSELYATIHGTARISVYNGSSSAVDASNRTLRVFFLT